MPKVRISTRYIAGSRQRNMNKSKRNEALMPGGIPRYVRCYDNGGETADRYTVVFTGRYTHKTGRKHWYVGMSALPFHPQGVGMHGESDRQIDTREGSYGGPAIGKKCHLGTRVKFEELPHDCRKLVLQDYGYLWDIDTGSSNMKASTSVIGTAR